MDNLSPYVCSKSKELVQDEFEFFRKFSHSPSKSSSSTISPEKFLRPRSKSMLTRRATYLYPPDIHVRHSPGSASPNHLRNPDPIIKTSFRSRSMKDRCVTGQHRRSTYVPLVESEQNFLSKKDSLARNREYKTLVWCQAESGRGPADDGEIQLYRMRSFKRTSKGIISQADTIKARSINSLEKFDSLDGGGGGCGGLGGLGGGPAGWDRDEPEEAHLPCYRLGISCASEHKTVNRLEVQIIGSNFVGKTTMASQFMTSEHICGRMDSVNEDADKFVSVFFDDQEWNIWLHDTENKKDSESNEVTVELLSGMNGYMVVYAIDNMFSFVYTKHILTDLVEKASRDSVIALVGNKIDLERCREVSRESGKQLAKIHRCLFYEVSTAINHKVDELLIQTLMKIRNNLKAKEKRFLKYSNLQSTNRRVSSFRNSGKKIRSFFKRKFNVKSCEIATK